MRAIDPLLAEFEHEYAATRSLLEALPVDRYDWKPHERSMTVGQLGVHVARLPKVMPEVLGPDAFDFADRPEDFATVPSREELLALADESHAEGRAFLESLDDTRAMAEWSLVSDGKTLMAMPRIAAIRPFMLNHGYHHRGQLSVYLRLLDQAVPSVYGPTADVNPFG